MHVPVQRVRWADGSFVDVPGRLEVADAWLAYEAAAPPPRVEMRGTRLASLVDGFALYSCGGLLAKLAVDAPEVSFSVCGVVHARG